MRFIRAQCDQSVKNGVFTKDLHFYAPSKNIHNQAKYIIIHNQGKYIIMDYCDKKLKI